jgi:two-component system NtrC family response regulator
MKMEQARICLPQLCIIGDQARRTISRNQLPAIPETLLESELFGHEKGAFMDAGTQKRGLFELADRGTFFLDEIDGIAHGTSSQSQAVTRAGRADQMMSASTFASSRPIEISYRAVKEGAFRQDLYYRLM